MLNQFLTTILAVFAGGLLSIIGGVSVTFLAQRSEKRKIFQGKVEELFMTVLELGYSMLSALIKVNRIIINQIDSEEDKEYIENLLKEMNHTGRKIRMLVLLYTPDLTEEFETYTRGMNELMRDINKFMKEADKTKADYMNNNRQRYTTVENAFCSSIQNFANKRGYSG